jgi:hypothetical protein
MKDITGLPVLGVISMVRTDDYMQKRRMAIVAFTSSWLLLLATYGGVAMVEIMDLDLVAKVSSQVRVG